MGLFDFYKKKNTELNSEHIVNPERKTIVPVEEITEGGHGDHWAALFGFNKFYNDVNLGREMLDRILHKGVKSQLANEYSKQELDYTNFKLKSISLNEQLITSFPVGKTNILLPTNTKVIREWAHSNGIEGQIESKGKGTFGLSFFATDYLENKNIYQSKFDLNINLIGFAYSVEPPPQIENTAEDFVGYIPNNEYRKLSVIDYVGKILELKEINETELGIRGYIAKLRLIQMDEEKDFFVLDTFICEDNLEIPNISIGDRISGTMWLQGQIADL